MLCAACLKTCFGTPATTAHPRLKSIYGMLHLWNGNLQGLLSKYWSNPIIPMPCRGLRSLGKCVCGKGAHDIQDFLGSTIDSVPASGLHSALKGAEWETFKAHGIEVLDTATFICKNDNRR
jgi:hypothetical protein